MRRPASLVAIVALLVVTRFGALGHAEPATEKVAHGPKTPPAAKDPHATTHAPTAKDSHAPAPKDSHGSVATPATLKPPTHKLTDPSAAHPALGDTQSKSPTSTDSHGGASGTHSTRARPPNPALEAVLQRLSRRMSTARSAEGSSTERTAGRDRSGRSTVKAPHSAAAPAPTFRAQVTAPHASEPSDTPRVHLTWRPTVIWPRAVLPGGDADTRIRVEWSR